MIGEQQRPPAAHNYDYSAQHAETKNKKGPKAYMEMKYIFSKRLKKIMAPAQRCNRRKRTHGK